MAQLRNQPTQNLRCNVGLVRDMSKVFYQEVLSTRRVQLNLLSRSVRRTWTIFLYFNLKQKTVFTNNVQRIWFTFRKYSLEKKISLNLQFWTILLSYKMHVTEKRT